MLTIRSPYIQQAEVNLNTGVVGEWHIIWNGTGGMVCAPMLSHVLLRSLSDHQHRPLRARTSTAKTDGIIFWLLKVSCLNNVVSWPRANGIQAALE